MLVTTKIFDNATELGEVGPSVIGDGNVGRCCWCVVLRDFAQLCKVTYSPTLFQLSNVPVAATTTATAVAFMIVDLSMVQIGALVGMPYLATSDVRGEL